MSQVAIVGGGPWGIALARAAARTGASVIHYTRRETKESRLVEITSSLEVAARAKLIVLAVPSEVAREVARGLGDHVDGSHLIVHGVRGLDPAGLQTISDIVRAETPVRRLGALGGPVQAAELHHGTASAIVVGSPYPEVIRAVTSCFSGPWLRVFSTSDLRGLEWASALVGCVSLGVGFAESAGAGPGLLAALIARAMHDAGRIAALAGAEEPTIYGLGGYGDLLASIALEKRPEVVVGRVLAQGRSVAEAIAEAELRVEAIELIPRLCEFAHNHGLKTPAFEGLARMLEGQPGEDILGRFFQV
jgi:glycerol-3-phosphate dehydrogenase (NAD(P)+)